ncbi:hypothetical protein NEOC84_001648|nr:hypothetical protein [Neochlamydia sp. AcF84]
MLHFFDFIFSNFLRIKRLKSLATTNSNLTYLGKQNIQWVNRKDLSMHEKEIIFFI